MKTMYKIIFLIVTLVPILTGCSQFEEMNHNPNQQTYRESYPIQVDAGYNLFRPLDYFL